jgi:predicted DNA-binding helix-hairpin-helix protein
MSKTPITKQELLKTIQTTQIIEGYKKASDDVVKKVKSLRKQYGIKVSPKR